MHETLDPAPPAMFDARRRTRLIQLGVVVALVTAGNLALATTSATKRTVIGPGRAHNILGTVESMIGGIPERANVLGFRGAPVTLVYFGDLECPYCREFTLGALPSLIRRWVRTGKLRIVFHSLETATREPAVFKTQQVAALAAGNQRRMWYFIELFYHEQGVEDSGYVTEQYLENLAQQVPGLNLPQWIGDRDEAGLAAEVAADIRLDRKLRLSSTPSLFFGLSGGAVRRYNPSSLTDPKGFDKEIETLLASAGRGL